MPRIRNLALKIVSTNQQADGLTADGLELRPTDRDKLDKGGIAFCIFVERELAHIGWVAMTEEAKKSLDELPYQVDFSNNEAITTRVWTKPKYRGMGLQVYSYFKRSQFLKERGIVAARAVIHTSNIASQTAYGKFGPNLLAKARYIKILGWQFWKEKPLPRANS